MDSRATPDATVSNNATANPVALPIPLSSLLGGIVAGTSFLRLLLPATIDDVFSLVPHHTIFSPVASLPLPFLWNLLTAHLFEAGLLRAVLVVPAIVYMAERLERLWSWRSMCLYLAFCCISSSIVLLAWEVVEVFRTANEKDFFSGTRGCSGLLVTLSVGLRHAYPLEVLPYVPKPWGIQCQHLPFCIATAYTVLGLLGPQLIPEWPFAPIAFFAAWFYLRYLMWFSHAKAYGDHSPDFVFANLFPQALRPIVSAVGALSHNLAASLAPGLLRIRQPEDEERPEAVMYDPSHTKDGAVLWNMAGAMSLANASSSLAWPAAPSGQPMPGAPGSKEYDARRAKALKLLDESISSLLVPSGAESTVPAHPPENLPEMSELPAANGSSSPKEAGVPDSEAASAPV